MAWPPLSERAFAVARSKGNAREPLRHSRTISAGDAAEWDRHYRIIQRCEELALHFRDRHDAITAPESSTMYRVMFEDRALEPIDDYDVYATRGEALATFEDAVADPLPGLGSVYVIEDDGHDERVIEARYFF